MESEIKFSYEHCLQCNDYEECADCIMNQPELIIKCIHFGWLREQLEKIMAEEK